MSWKQLTVVVSADQLETTSSLLEMFLANAVTTENAGEDEFYEVAFPGKPDWKKVRITGLFPSTVDLQPIIEFITDQLQTSTSDEIPVTVDELIDRDWERVWLDSYKPIKVGTNLWVCPSWCDPIEQGSRNIILDPGLAFGTGTHATTAMCLDWISNQQLQNQSVLDYGSGSGILAIATLFSGADHADAVDIDPLAVEACIKNAKRNQVESKFNAYHCDQTPNKQYDLVIANILADVIIELHDTLLLHLDPLGTILLTGILNTQVERVIQNFENSIKFDQYHQDEWALLVGKPVNKIS